MRANHFSRVFFINEESNEMRETEAGEREIRTNPKEKLVEQTAFFEQKISKQTISKLKTRA
jgi:hypothetical protein